jgi:uncharacterized protein YfdQ (DUF2303 family)
MNIETLKEIQALIAAAHKSPETDVPLAIVPESCSVVSLEKYMSQPTEFRGQLKTSSMQDYARYVERCIFHDANPLVFVDPESMSAKAFFDLGDIGNPFHGEHTALLKLKSTAPFDAILAISGCAMSQRELSEWIQDWFVHLEAQDGSGAPINMAKAANSVRNITIDQSRKEEHEDGDFRGSRSAMEQIEASSKDGLPAGFVFECQPYHSLDHRKFYLRLSVVIRKDEQPRLKLRITKLEAAQEEMAIEFKDKLDESLSDDCSIFVGSFSK